MSVTEEQLNWNKRLGHANLRLISKLRKLELVRGLSNLKYKSEVFCEACRKGKRTKSYFSSKKFVSTEDALSSYT